MAAERMCVSCRWRRTVPGPTPLGEGPYHWCANLASYYYAGPVTDTLWCPQFSPCHSPLGLPASNADR
jgi:hypothetical protein